MTFDMFWEGIYYALPRCGLHFKLGQTFPAQIAFNIWTLP